MSTVGWRVAKLRELTCKVGSGATPTGGQESYHSTGTPLIRSQNVHFDGFREEGLVFLNEEQAAGLDGAAVRGRDVLLNITGASIGRVTVAPAHLDGARVNQHVCLIRPLEGINPSFLRWFLASPNQQSLIFRMQVGATRQALTKEMILNFDVPVPPTTEQERIVAKVEELLSDLDAGVAALERARANLKKYRAAVLKAAVTGELTADWRAAHPNVEPATKLLDRILAERREKWEAEQQAKFTAKNKPPPKGWQEKYKAPPSASNGREQVPAGWCWATLSQVATFQNGRPFPSTDYTDEGVKLLRPGNLYSDGTVGWTEKNTKRLPEKWLTEFPDSLVSGNELVMNLTAQSLKDEFLGRTCLTSPNERCLLNQRLARITPSPGIHAKFVLYLLKSGVFRQFVNQLNTGSLIQHMFTSQLDEFVLPLPPFAEQEAIVAEVEQQLSVIAATEDYIAASLKRAVRLRQSILKEAFAGRLVPQDPNDEPASVLLTRLPKDYHSVHNNSNGRRARTSTNQSRATQKYPDSENGGKS